MSIVMKKEFPNGWTVTNLNSIASSAKNAIVDGPFGSNLLLTDYVTDGEIPVLTTKILRDVTEIKNARKISLKKFKELERSQIKGGDILIAKIGSVGVNCIYPKDYPIALIPANLCKITHNENIINLFYLKFWLDSLDFKNLLKDIVSSTAQPAFGITKFKKLPIPLPPLNEQKRIVSKIEELFSKIESAKQSLEHTKLQLEQYRESLLKSAFEGKLTEQWRKENKINENYDNNPLGDLIIFSKNGFTGKPNELKKGTPRLGIETITQSNSIYINESMHKFIEIPKSKIETYRAKIGDLFVCRQNGNQNYVGKCAVFKEIISPTIFSDSLIQFRINTKLLSSTYLAFFLNSHLGRRQIEKFCSTTAGNFSINGINFKKTMIQYPSLAEQEQIVSIIEQGFSLIQNTTQIVESSLQNLQTMKMSVLKQAFEGKLVPQDPNDEPASVILEKIKSTKESQNTKQRRTKNVK